MKNSFVMYTDWKLMIEAMDNESRGELLLAIMQYQGGEDITVDNPQAAIAFAAMKPQFDKDKEKYDESLRKRSEAGKVAAQARKEKSNRNESLPIVTNEQQSLHDNVNVNDNVNDNVNVNDNDNDNITPLNPPKGKRKTKVQEMQEAYDRYLQDHDFSNEVLGVLADWLEHKTEIKDPYTEIGMKKFLNKVDDQRKLYGDSAVVNIINDSISSGYKGVVWDRIRGPAKPKNSLEEWLNA